MTWINVDQDRCEGHGVCQDMAPDIFEVDDDGMVQVLHNPVPIDLAVRAESGVGACPVAALSIADR